jgi:hypothetical protein
MVERIIIMVERISIMVERIIIMVERIIIMVEWRLVERHCFPECLADLSLPLSLPLSPPPPSESLISPITRRLLLDCRCTAAGVQPSNIELCHMPLNELQVHRRRDQVDQRGGCFKRYGRRVRSALESSGRR